MKKYAGGGAMELPGKGTAIDAALARGREASYRGRAALDKLADLRQRMGVKRPVPTPKVGMTKAQLTAKNAPQTGGGMTAQTPPSAMSPAKTANMRKGGKVKSSASKRADGIASRGKTRGKFV